MIRLATKPLSHELLLELEALQSQVKGTFGEMTVAAQKLWKTKGGIKGKEAFIRLRRELMELCVFVRVCNYCEQNEASDVEHVYPKSFFPWAAFVWENYLLACKHCNTTFKLDKFHVIDDQDELLFVPRGTEPRFHRVAFINPRTDDPNDFMYLDPLTFRFEIHDGLSKADHHKALMTRTILELNERDTLIAARKCAAKYYFDRLDRLRKILNSPDVASLQDNLNPADGHFDFSIPLDAIKSDVREAYRKDIISHQHPSVWQAIKKIQSKVDPRWMQIFEYFPDAINW